MLAVRLMSSKKILSRVGLALFAANALPVAGQSEIVSREIRSTRFSGNKIETSAVRNLLVYLHAEYKKSTKRFPVVYFMPDAFEGYRAPFERHGAQG